MPARGRAAFMEKLRRWIIEDMPDELAACECECRRLSCRYGDWETCERRLGSQRRLMEERQSGPVQ